ncbi:uncharacterized protein LOC110668858 [Hevea brasiliensis]|uniref:uncharacterized protein LOC110668858 n=1 Tax=Hevea brasiliensis TaxID=3981 RepID=UPI0025D709E6|nr:uncharacterized protein LOC110668858 [Hevea brasiliensis]
MKKPLAGVYELDAKSMFNAKFNALTRKMYKLSMKVDALIRGSSNVEDVGAGNMHCINDFASYGQEFGNEQVDFVGNYNQKPVDAISQMPSYAKFLKEILSNKRRLEDYETVALTEECSALLQNKLPPKLKDPGSFFISCHIRDTSIDKALSIKYLVGILENVPLKVRKFFIPVDFVVLEIEEDIHIPIISGRPFLATIGAIIDVKNGRLTLKVGEEEVEFNLTQALKKHHEVNPCLRVDVIDEIMEEEFRKRYPEDPLENCLVHSRTTKDENPEVVAFAQILGTTQEVVGDQVLQVEELKHEVAQPPLLDKKEAPQVDLKPLPSTLRYAFLRPNSTYLVIISASLSDVQVEKLLRELRAHRKVISYTIDNIMGINPTLCMHTILLEDNFKATIEHQRRLNPNMKEVVKKGGVIIYPISDSSWVSPVHVVPKKGGVTVMKNENNELMTTRIVTGWRMCVDYRKLNSATRKDHFPLPFIDQMLKRLKEALTIAPIMQPPDWSLPVEVICDASDFVVGVVLGQKKEKRSYTIYYASKTLDDAQVNYATTEKEFLAVVFAMEKFRSYLVGSKVIVYTDHAAIRYLMNKKEAKPRLIRWVLLL